MDYWRTRVKFGADKMVDLSISWKPWRGQQPGGFQIGHSSSLLSLILTHQYSNTPPIPNQYQSTNTATGGCCSRCIGGLYQCSKTPPAVLSPPTVGSAVSLGNYSGCRRYCWQLLLSLLSPIVPEKKPGSMTKTYPCQQDLGFCEDKHH